MISDIYEEKERRESYNDFTNSEGVIPVIFLKELLKEAFELNPQSNAKAKNVLFLFLPEAIRFLNSLMR